MIVDSSAQPEQVVQDALQSAFGSAGQRCSALRLLCLQQEIAGPVLEMLLGAAAELRSGDPALISTDVGPVIDAAARAGIEAHIDRFADRLLLRLPAAGDAAQSCFVAPAIIEIGSVAELQREVFGPVLHVLRYRREDLGALIDAINATGYGLTCGIHSRIDETIDFIAARIRAGNVYVNRNMIGAVVGVQPFGGEGLSGTGPKAGGPWTVLRLQHAVDTLSRAPLALGAARVAAAPGALQDLQQWLQDAGQDALAGCCAEYSVTTPIGCHFALGGPTGESNALRYHARGRVLCVPPAGAAPSEDAVLLGQLAAVVATGNRALVIEAPPRRALVARLPESVRAVVDWSAALWSAVDAEAIDLALLDGTAPQAAELRRRLAARAGARVAVVCARGRRYALDRMVAEQVLSVNTAAAGGNASLMTLTPA